MIMYSMFYHERIIIVNFIENIFKFCYTDRISWTLLNKLLSYLCTR